MHLFVVNVGNKKQCTHPRLPMVHRLVRTLVFRKWLVAHARHARVTNDRRTLSLESCLRLTITSLLYVIACAANLLSVAPVSSCVSPFGWLWCGVHSLGCVLPKEHEGTVVLGESTRSTRLIRLNTTVPSRHHRSVTATPQSTGPNGPQVRSARGSPKLDSPKS